MASAAIVGRPAPLEGNEPNDDRSVARAAAEVSIQHRPDSRPGSNTTARQRAPGSEAAHAAIQGNVGEGTMGEAQAFEVLDEGGELVRVRFQEFLNNYSEVIYKEMEEVEENLGNDQSAAIQRSEQEIYPYHDQANFIAKRRLKAANPISLTFQEVDQDDTDMPLTPFSSTICVNYSHLLSHDRDLAEAIEGEYVRFEPYLRRAAKEFLLAHHPELDQSDPTGILGSTLSARSIVNTYFVALYNAPMVLPVRALRTGTIGRFASFTGTVTRTSEVRPELLVGSFRCRKCGLVAPKVIQQYHLTRPALCRNPRCQNRNPSEFHLELAMTGDTGEGATSMGGSEFVDWQRLKVQENAEEIPPGSMPRTIDVIVRNEMVERAKAGDRVVLTGSLVVVPDGSALARAGEAARSIVNNDSRVGREAATGGGGGVKGLAALGVRELTYRTCFVACSVLPYELSERLRRRNNGMDCDNDVDESNFFSLGFGTSGGWVSESPKTSHEVAMEFTAEEKDEIRRFKHMPRLYDLLAESIAPATFGHIEVKRGILLMLLGGVHKTTSEGIRLRGDINVCIVGDPSTAKSQFLKFVHDFLPDRCVYTSGKAATAAGLTAAVTRDQDTGEYCIEAGAMMLADNGICCIDEFDKMDQHDQVAIHEAMEQQTISITKAGIQATLNARASILAAANPIHGRYDRSKTLRANVQLSAPILSRFDLFFVVLDECDEVSDYNVAKHIIDVHRCDENVIEPPFTEEQMLRYIRFARTLSPQITEECRRVIVDCYRKLRQGDTMGRSRTAYRITVRQLESLIRLSEALARLHCDDVVRPSYVREAFRLLRKSIIHVETEDVTFDEEGDDYNSGNGENNDDVADGGQMGGTHTNGDQQSQPNPIPGITEVGIIPEDTSQQAVPEKSKKIKKRTQISFEQYESISNAIATYLRSKELDELGSEGDSSSCYLSWGQAVEWYLEQCKTDIGDSVEELQRLRKLVNLVIKRLVQVDHVLVYIGESEGVLESERKIAVHPNYDYSTQK